MTEEQRKEDILKQYKELPKGVVKYIDFLITKINKLVVENKRKQAQIKKMKCCANCSKWLDCKSEIPTEVCKDWKMEEEE